MASVDLRSLRDKVDSLQRRQLKTEKAVFAFGPGGRFFYNAPTKCRASNNLPSDIDKFYDDDKVKDVRYVAFGPDPRSYFFNYEMRNFDYGEEAMSHYKWSNLPAPLERWLKIPGLRDMRISFGSKKNSYFAWDAWSCKSYRWHNVPESLEETIQGWLTNDSATYGNPRWVSLGMNESYVAISLKLGASYSLAESYPTLQALIISWAQGPNNFWREVKYIYLDPFRKDTYAVVFIDGKFSSNGPLDVEEDLQIVGIGINDPVRANQLFEKKARRKAWAKTEARRRMAQEAKEKAAKEARAKRAKEEEEAAAKKARMKIVYLQWLNLCIKTSNDKTCLMVFPHPPLHFNECKELNCSFQKLGDHGLSICVHDLERLLRCDPDYSKEWLKSRRNQFWHSDKWSSAPLDERKSFKAKADELFKMYGQLMEKL